MQFYTEDLGDFGYRELEKLRDLLDQYIENDLPDGYDLNGLKPAFNMNSGNLATGKVSLYGRKIS